jgi:hypothetical protein
MGEAFFADLETAARAGAGAGALATTPAESDREVGRAQQPPRRPAPPKAEEPCAAAS